MLCFCIFLKLNNSTKSSQEWQSENMATINDIAKMAGVSAATVSHVVNKTRYVSPELARRVQEAINALEYPPNFVVKKSKSLILTTDTKYVVLLASDLHNTHQSEVIKNIEKFVNDAGYSLISVNYSDDIQKLDLYAQLLLTPDNAVGIIAFPDSNDKLIQKLLGLTKIPVVLVGKPLEAIPADVILSDNFGGAYRATNHLIKSGHEDIAYINNDKSSELNIERINGYKKALADNNIQSSPSYIINNVLSEPAFFQTLRSLNLLQNPPTAILSANYKTTIAILKFIDTNNINCPKDLSIISFDDFDWAELYTPSITAVAQDTLKIGQTAATVLIERITKIQESKKVKSKLLSVPDTKTIIVPAELRVRASTNGIGRGPFGEKAAAMDTLLLTESDRKLIHTKQYTAAISFHYTGKAWMQLHEQGIKDTFNSLGISLLAITDAHFNPAMQNKQLESLLNLEPDVIISIPTDNTETAEAYKKIANSKTKLILITNVPDGLTPRDYVTCISVNEHSHGRLVGRGLGEYMHKHGLSNVGFIKHGASFYATSQRDNAAEHILMEEYPEIDLCAQTSFKTEKDVYQKTIEMMTLHPEIQGIYVSWEGPASYAISALADIGRTDVVIATADLEYSLALNMAKGGMVKAISAQRPYEQGQAMAIAAANALIGKSVPPFIGIEPLYVTQGNLLKAWEKVYKEAPPEQLLDILKNPNSTNLNSDIK